jgi:large subunit ribosomal protein L13
MTTKKPKAEKQDKKTTTKQAKKVAKASTAARKIAGKTQVRLSRAKSRLATKLEAGKKDPKASRKKVKPIGHAPHSARITAPKGPIKPLASRTIFGVKHSSDRKWLLVDAAGQTVGRLASEIAMLLRGKHKPTFTPNNDEGDFVVVVNAEKVKFTANKEEQKTYNWHSGYIGGIKEASVRKMRETYPDRILFKAVKGMISRNPLGRDQMRKLKIYAGEKHPHAAQTPVVWKLRNDSNA